MATSGGQSFGTQVRNWDPDSAMLTVVNSIAQLSDPGLMNIEDETEFWVVLDNAFHLAYLAWVKFGNNGHCIEGNG